MGSGSKVRDAVHVLHIVASFSGINMVPPIRKRVPVRPFNRSTRDADVAHIHRKRGPRHCFPLRRKIRRRRRGKCYARIRCPRTRSAH